MYVISSNSIAHTYREREMSKNSMSRDDSKKFEYLMKKYSPLIPEAVARHSLKKAGFKPQSEET